MRTYEIPLKIALQVKAKNGNDAIQIALREQLLIVNRYRYTMDIHSISNVPLTAYIPLIDWFESPYHYED